MEHRYSVPRTAWFCSFCGMVLHGPDGRCGCGGGAVPEGLLVPIERAGRGAPAALLKRLRRLFGAGSREEVAT